MMGLNQIRSGLRTIHNGSHDVAKAQVIIPAGDELTVSEYVAEQLQRDSAFKDGPAPVEADVEPEVKKAGPRKANPPKVVER